MILMIFFVIVKYNNGSLLLNLYLEETVAYLENPLLHPPQKCRCCIVLQGEIYKFFTLKHEHVPFAAVGIAKKSSTAVGRNVFFFKFVANTISNSSCSTPCPRKENILRHEKCSVQLSIPKKQ